MEAQPVRGLVIAPMGIGQVLDSAFTLARRHFRLLATIAAWGLVPGFALQALFNMLLYSGGSSPALALVAGFSGGIISSIATVLAMVAVMAACRRLVQPAGQDLPTAGQSYRDAFSCTGSCLLAGILFLLGFFALVLLIVTIPLALYVYVRWLPAFAVIVAERAGPITALSRSWLLTGRAWWHTATVMLLAGLAIWIIQMVTLGVFGVVVAILAFMAEGAALARVLGAVLGAVLNAVGAIVTTPFGAAVAMVLYYELRARAEGFDLEQRMLQLAPAE